MPAVPIATLRSWLPAVDEMNLFGRQILASDLTLALRFLESQTAAFHTGRMKTLLLERDQKKPQAYSDEGAFFVVSKLNLGAADDKQSSQSVEQQFRDVTMRQVFHEYDKLNLGGATMNLTSNGSTTTGQSPAKSLM